MAATHDYQSEQIKKSIQNFKSKSNELKNVLSRHNYWSEIHEAENALNTYSSEESRGVKNAEGIIDKALSGSGAFSNDGFNAAIETEENNTYKKANDIISSFIKDSERLLETLPQIGPKG